MQLRFSATVCALAVLPMAAGAQPSDSFQGLILNLIELQETCRSSTRTRSRGRAVFWNGSTSNASQTGGATP